MSKPSYAAVAAHSPTEGEGLAPVHPAEPGSAGGPSEPPPPYTTVKSSRHPDIAIQSQAHPHQQQGQQQQQVYQPHPHHHAENGAITTAYHPHGQQGWAPPPSPAVARSRAQRRFWVAFFWAWVVYLIIGLIVGGGISDIEQNPPGRHGHWDKHGNWRTDVDVATGETMAADIGAAPVRITRFAAAAAYVRGAVGGSVEAQR